LRLNQSEVSALVHISRPTLWNWEQGRVPQERSLRHLHSVAAAVDVLVDAAGGEAEFDPVRVATALGLGVPLDVVLAMPDGPVDVLGRLFAKSRQARRASLMPTADDFSDTAAELESPPSEVLPMGRRLSRRRVID
jgi:transcriptional regulator with XRE-family HTH domain